MDSCGDKTTDQSEIWNGAGGEAWVVAQSLLDRAFAPLERLLADAVPETSASCVLDVGCGTGATTMAAARRLGAAGDCVGIDLSGAMIDAARARAAREGVPARFLRADAQTYEFEPESVDMIISRFGIMFFDDPVAAFVNLRRAASAGTGLCCIAWRSPAENPFMTTAERAAEPLLPGVSRRVPNEPGQFAFADHARVQDILTRGGWQAIDVAPIDVSCAFPASELDLYVSRLGPVGRALRGVDEKDRARVIETVRPAFEPYIHGAEVRFTAACWTIRARA
ncbi:class I SAM-dependent methyltransferase [Arhodomonas sp. AD133]|uniref:class I SAM-dependent methyltransferase n=1 Tax=Arhodomonas sp. AD133 TaxID=3415009 RepID=UPI003EC113DB